MKNTLGDTVGEREEGNTEGTEVEKEDVALKKERAEMLFLHREVRPRASAPDWSDTHVASRCLPTGTQGEKSSCRTDAAATAFEAAAHAPITDGTHVHARTPRSCIV